ncbi:PLP-dependent aminotransferase family protein [Bacillus sp. 03113]|uniref:MocR-like pyridoxine biosynthesis transcription factor PdxR n=1 Tax=Bacillus sp. 03113 TaxID=2578211 RepID=UPI001144FE12|nr:PLP-dependent aminotransferase family protein [Bacillus sp. 03113]
MRITVDKNLAIPAYVQIKKRIHELILSGSLPKGFVLPPERKLALKIGVSRSTVIKAYDELKAVGLVESHVGKGTIVTADLEAEGTDEDLVVLPVSWHSYFNENLDSTNDTVSGLMNMDGKNVISFAAGIADPMLYPTAQLQEIQNSFGGSFTKEMLNLSAVEGYFPLRESLCQLMEGRSISATAKEMMILSGSMQGIDFATRTFLTPGDIVIVEEPSFLQALQLFKAAGAKVISVALDNEGIRTDMLEVLLKRHKPKFIYTIPTFQNPTGIVMSMKRRIELLHLAYKYNVPILEDDPYGELTFSGHSLPPLKALDQHGYVIYLSTFSKVLFSGMRIGWVVAPAPVIKKFVLLKQMADLHVNTPSQYLLDRFLRKGYYEKHLSLITNAYVRKRDVMVKALKEKPELLHFNIPDGGYYLWCKLPQGISQTKLWNALSSKGVIYTPGNVFFSHENEGGTYIRLNFTYESNENIEKGISILSDEIQKLNQHKLVDDFNQNSNPIV